MNNETRKNFKEAKITPRAYMVDLSGVKFVIEIKRNGKTSYAIVFPPDYEIEDERNEGLLASATVNHYFIPYKGEAYPFDQYKEKLKLLEKELLEKKNKK